MIASPKDMPRSVIIHAQKQAVSPTTEPWDRSMPLMMMHSVMPKPKMPVIEIDRTMLSRFLDCRKRGSTAAMPAHIKTSPIKMPRLFRI